MVKYALVGNIASGKSTTEKILEEHGFAVLDTDKVSHELLINYKKEIIELFPSVEIRENGEISRTKLGEIVFSDKNKKTKLEKFLHPLIREKIIDFQKQHQTCFVSIPLLFEANMRDLFDKIIFIMSDDELRLKRLIERNNYSVEYAKIRMASQGEQGEKARKSDYVVHNNGTIDDLKREIFKIVL